MKSLLLSRRLLAPKISWSGQGLLLMAEPKSIRKLCMMGFEFTSTIHSLSAFSAISKYDSKSNGESCKVAWLFKNPSRETASGGKISVKLSSIFSNSRSVFLYWATVSLLAPPFLGVGLSLAISVELLIQDISCWRSDFVGCALPLGGIASSLT